MTDKEIRERGRYLDALITTLAREIRAVMDAQRRTWWYSYQSWTPRWWNYLIPYCGGDEWGRHTLVIHIPPRGFLVVAYWTCRCAECVQVREQTLEDLIYQAETPGEDS